MQVTASNSNQAPLNNQLYLESNDSVLDCFSDTVDKVVRSMAGNCSRAFFTASALMGLIDCSILKSKLCAPGLLYFGFHTLLGAGIATAMKFDLEDGSKRIIRDLTGARLSPEDSENKLKEFKENKNKRFYTQLTQLNYTAMAISGVMSYLALPYAREYLAVALAGSISTYFITYLRNTSGVKTQEATVVTQ